MELSKLLDSTNIAEHLDDDKLIEIGKDVVEGYDSDLASRKPWEADLKNWTELALQVTHEKTFPWPNAANIKYPLLSTAAMQFAARAYPTLIPSNGQVVKCKVIGSDPDGQKTMRAERVAKHMSYQVMEEMDEWEEDMDKLLLSVPIAGTAFKKTYWDAAKQRNCSKLVLPKSLVVNYYARSLEDAERVTEVFYLTRRQIKERQNRKLFLDIDLGDPITDSLDQTTTTVNNVFQHDTANDNATPYTILEQHCFIDLDDDGYSEPYVVTVEAATQKVLRITPRFVADDVELSEDGKKIVSITPMQYYTKYGFIPNPDGGFYDIGFGRLLGPLNNSANTLINQLVDAGSLSNLQAGFIGKGLRIKMGESRFQPGEWKAVNAIGDDLKKQIFPLPVREPSQVLFNLLDLLLKSGKELASVAEIFVGKMPGQNTPATTTMATIEQGMKVFTAVYKRLYRALTSEFRKLYKLNKIYLNPQEEIDILDEPIQQSDYFGPEKDIVPAADPNAVSSQEKQAKVQAVMQILQLGTVDPMWATKLYMEAHEINGWEQGVHPPQPQQDPKQQELQMKAQLEQQKAQRDMMMASEKLKLEQMSKEQEMAHKAKMQQMELQAKQMEAILSAKESQAKLQAQQQQHQQNLVQQHQQNQMNMVTTQANHQMQMQHQQEANKQKLTVSKEKPTNAKSVKK
jgi:chaperonin GroES